MSKNLNLVWMAVGAAVLIFIIWFVVHEFEAGSGNKGFIVPVTPVTAQQQTWQNQIDAVGTLEATEGTMVSPEVSGLVQKIYFKSGDDVEQGTPLVQLDPSVLEAQLAAAQSEIPLDQNQFQRASDLYKKGVGSKESVDQALATLNNAQAQVAQAKAELDKKLIKAPFTGRLGLRQINLGDYLNPGSPIVNLQMVDPMRVSFDIPEIYFPDLAIGDKAQLTSTAYPNQVFTGKLFAIDSAVNTNSRSLSVWASVPNEDHKLVPGSFVSVTLFVGQPRQVIAVPQTAIVYSTTGNYVYKIIDGKAVKIDVILDKRKGDFVEIKQGLSAGDQIVGAGQSKLYDGAPITLEKTQTDNKQNSQDAKANNANAKK